ncbi:MAG: HAD-IIA family hydrolase [Candidatus Nanohaloarchaea archaeon]
MKIQDFKYFFFDLDNTLIRWNDTLIGAEDLIYTLKDKNKQVFYHTDNTLLSRQEYAEKLTEQGIPAEKQDVMTSGYVAAKKLEQKETTKTYAVGESGITKELEETGVKIVEDAENAVIGFDRQFNYDKIKRIHKILDNGGKAYLCSNEKTFNTGKTTIPHQHAINASIKSYGATELVGKPSQEFRDRFKKYFDYMVNHSIMIGDRLEDIETGNRLGMKTAAVMSGDLTKPRIAEAEQIQTPDFGISSLHRLKNRII